MFPTPFFFFDPREKKNEKILPTYLFLKPTVTFICYYLEKKKRSPFGSMECAQISMECNRMSMECNKVLYGVSKYPMLCHDHECLTLQIGLRNNRVNGPDPPFSQLEPHPSLRIFIYVFFSFGVCVGTVGRC